MTKYIVYILILLYTVSAGSCDDKDVFQTKTLSIRLSPPKGFEDFPMDSIPIQVTNQSIGTIYTIYTNNSGIAQADLTAGTLQINIQKTISKGYVDYIFYGGYNTLYFGTDGNEQSLDIDLGIAEQGRLLIEELYFSGCTQPDGKSTYVKDQYITVANNSGQVIYLDGICIGQIAPVTTSKPSGWMIHTDMKELPLFMMCWQFPGKGTDHPLLPGERQVIATNAVDHTAGEAGIPASLDLSHVEWAFWNTSLTGSQISTGVKPLDLIWRSGGTSFAMTATGPTMILFLPDVDIKTYASDPSHLRTEPGSTSKNLYLHIPADWVQDAANFVSSVSTKANTRLPFSIDGNPGVAQAQGSGIAFCRFKPAIQFEDMKWKDSNNTAEDFNECKPSMQKP